HRVDFVRMVAATITSMVPQGLVLTATLSFTLGAMHMSSRGAVVQRLNAVETMAAIDVICTDKTGTLTTNRLKLVQMHCVARDVPEETIKERLRSFATASIDQGNKNIQAIRTALGEAKVKLLDQVPFKSQNRYSAVRIKHGGAERVLVLGAPEALRSRVQLWQEDTASWESRLSELRKTGLRILLFAEAAASPSPPGGEGGVRGDPVETPLSHITFDQTPVPALPEVPLRPLALVD